MHPGPGDPVLQPANSQSIIKEEEEAPGSVSTGAEIKPVRQPGMEGSGEAANLSGACWELNLAGEISAVSERDNPCVTASGAAMIPPVFL